MSWQSLLLRHQRSDMRLVRAASRASLIPFVTALEHHPDFLSHPEQNAVADPPIQSHETNE